MGPGGRWALGGTGGAEVKPELELTFMFGGIIAGAAKALLEGVWFVWALLAVLLA